MPSSAACSFRLNASMGITLEAGRIATVLRLMLLRETSDGTLLAEESASRLTRDAMFFNNLENQLY